MSRVRWILAVLLVLAALAACQTSPTPTPIREYIVVTATPGPTEVPTVAAAASDTSLLIAGSSVTQTLTLDDLKALPATEGWAGIKSSTGKITAPALFKGVSLQTLCELGGAFDSSWAANVVAKDGYAMTISYDQVMNGTFTTFDPATGDEVVRDEKLTAIVAYERDGQPLPEESDGTLRLVVVSSENNQVTDGHWSIKWVRQVVLKPAAAEWTLHLEGALVEDMDRGTFESGSAPNCHLAEWTDADGNTWGGIPLYYLLGRVDDEIKHETGAFNAQLAEQGYDVDVVAADGYKVTFNSQDLAYNKTIILASLMNDQPLADEYFPLRLVGSSLEKGQMVGAVAQIVLHLDEMGTTVAATSTPEPATPETSATAPEAAAGTLHIWGKVATPLAITQAEWAQMESVKISAEHPKKGLQDYEGVRLNDLLQQTQPASDAATVLFTAGDGYTAELPWATLTACTDCLVTFDGEAFGLVMPGQESGFWVKDIRLIEVK